MSKISNLIILILIVLLVLTFGFWWGQSQNWFESKEEESAEIMLEKVSKVFKLITLEASVSELYDYKQYDYWDINIFRKKALVRVKAKISIGYDFEKVNFVVDEKLKSIRIESFPSAEILSVDHDLDYYDLTEGLFNNFSAEDMTKIGANAKKYVTNMIETSDLFDQADAQKSQLLDLISELLKASGWRLESIDSANNVLG